MDAPSIAEMFPGLSMTTSASPSIFHSCSRSGEADGGEKAGKRNKADERVSSERFHRDHSHTLLVSRVFVMVPLGKVLLRSVALVQVKDGEMECVCVPL